MNCYRLRSYAEYLSFLNREAAQIEAHNRFLEGLKPQQDVPFTVPGFSYPAGKAVEFQCGFARAKGFPHVNWRESLICPVTGLNGRKRATLQVIDCELDLYSNSSIFLMEQVTDTYKYLKGRYKNLVGSEFLGESVPLGTENDAGIRNEDCTCLSFDSEVFDTVLSYDVFEHVPDFTLAFKESFRVLKPGGTFHFSVPFKQESKTNIIRAVIRENGEVEHLLEPQYHGDPISHEGVLCYQFFGWEMLGLLRDIGFEDAYALVFVSEAFGYYNYPIQFVARKARG